MNIEFKGATIFYTDTGSGNTIVLLHGFLENSSMWQPFLSYLSKSNRVICVDLLGHGQTECIGYVHTMEAMAEAVKVVLDHLGIDNTKIIGHSMGGYVALALAEIHPEVVTSLCLMNSTAEPDSVERKTNRERAIIAVKDNHKRFVKMGIVNLFRPKNRRIFTNEITQITNEALNTPLQGIIAALAGMKIRPDRTHVLKNYVQKALMIISKKDPVLNYETLQNQAKKANVKVVEFPDGHMSHVENKNEFLQKIMHFIENI